MEIPGKITAAVIDLKPLIDMFSSCGAMYWLYKQYPLKSIITTILSEEWRYEDNFERFCNECLNRGVELDEDEMELFQFFYDSLLECLDRQLYNKLKIDINLSELILEYWVDNTTVILRVEHIK